MPTDSGMHVIPPTPWGSVCQQGVAAPLSRATIQRMDGQWQPTRNLPPNTPYINHQSWRRIGLYKLVVTA